MREAVAGGHPRALCFRPTWELRTLATDGLGVDASKVELARTTLFKKWLTRKLHLKEEEQSNWESLALHLKPILKGERLILWKQILMGYADAGVPDEATDGFAFFGLDDGKQDLRAFLSDLRRYLSTSCARRPKVSTMM